MRAGAFFFFFFSVVNAIRHMNHPHLTKAGEIILASSRVQVCRTRSRKRERRKRSAVSRVITRDTTSRARGAYSEREIDVAGTPRSGGIETRYFAVGEKDESGESRVRAVSVRHAHESPPRKTFASPSAGIKRTCLLAKIAARPSFCRDFFFLSHPWAR